MRSPRLKEHRHFTALIVSTKKVGLGPGVAACILSISLLQIFATKGLDSDDFLAIVIITKTREVEDVLHEINAGDHAHTYAHFMPIRGEGHIHHWKVLYSI